MTSYIFIMVLIVVLCFLLVMVVLSQNPKGGGLSGAFGGSGGSQMFGVQKTNDFMEKSTWYLGGTIVLLVILSTVIYPRTISTKIEDTTPKTESTTPAANTPATNGTPSHNGGGAPMDGQ